VKAILEIELEGPRPLNIVALNAVFSIAAVSAKHVPSVGRTEMCYEVEAVSAACLASLGANLLTVPGVVKATLRRTDTPCSESG
jgi:hypothetical protein